jgi:hypothetical protein
MRPLRLSKPGQTKFERMANAAKKAKAFRDLVKTKARRGGKLESRNAKRETGGR